MNMQLSLKKKISLLVKQIFELYPTQNILPNATKNAWWNIGFNNQLGCINNGVGE